jgi:galactose-6-phosphate isomerase
MPDLDVSDVLLDPDFCETLTITRRPFTMVKGIATVTPTTISPAPVGVVYSISGDLIRQGADQQNLPNTIIVHTPFRLRGPAQGFLPDIVVWNGDNFAVTSVDNFSHFGSGFVSAICTSQDSVDNPPQ